MSDCKKSLDDLEEEARTNRTHLNEAKWFITSERSFKPWFNTFKLRVISTKIKSLFKPNSEEETEDPTEMLEIARDYHSQLQREPPMDEDRARAIKTILANMKRVLEEKDKIDIGKDISFTEVDKMIRKAPNGKAPGPDGIPNEFWKMETKWRDKMKKKAKEQPGNSKDGKTEIRPCIAALMTKVLLDIERHGPVDTQFTEARMGLLHKKKDKREVQNYRPITLLNTDLKMYTKTIANQLRKMAPKLIHKDQAGFMPEQSIYDQVKMVGLMIKWCENTDSEGMIVCLDQEKAYDRIDLQYLWKTLEAFGFPVSFITKVRSLYSSASTAI